MCLSFTLLYFLLERVNLCYNFVSLIVLNDSVKNAGTGFGICSRIFVFGVWVIKMWRKIPAFRRGACQSMDVSSFIWSGR